MFSPSAILYVADTGNNRVLVFPSFGGSATKSLVNRISDATPPTSSKDANYGRLLA